MSSSVRYNDLSGTVSFVVLYKYDVNGQPATLEGLGLQGREF